MKEEIIPSVSREEALASLAEIDRVADRIRKSIAAGNASPLLILWGAIWVVGFAVTKAYPDGAGRLWLVLDLIGIIASLLLGGWPGRPATKDPNRRRIGICWLTLIVYGVLWLLLLVPEAFHAHWMSQNLDWGHRIGAFWCAVAMFGYVVMGFWLSRFLLWLGLLITALTFAGLLFLPAYFYLWMAITGGGALLAAGIYIRQTWR